eukprot:237104-Hanusia_phi.AAC.2
MIQVRSRHFRPIAPSQGFICLLCRIIAGTVRYAAALQWRWPGGQWSTEWPAGRARGVPGTG